MQFEVYRDVQGHWRWRLRAANSEIIAFGESYYNKADCMHAITLVQQSRSAPVYDS